MKKPIGAKIQDLEKRIIETLKEKGLADHPHFYHGDIKNPEVEIALAYKIPEEFRTKNDNRRDPLFEALPLELILSRKYPGVLEIKTDYNKETKIHTIRMKVDYVSSQEAIELKYQLLVTIDEELAKVNYRPRSRIH